MEVGELKKNQPLVSVGIPTFNRPEGLRRTLRFICDQTYSNLEIIVSDNGSPSPATRAVVQEFSNHDRRVKYFRQATNIGPMGNFRFVLASATGEYFMWAADDDEWDVRFIETCLAAAAGRSCSAMTKFNTIYRAKNVAEENPIPPLSPDLKLVQNVSNYFSNMQPSLFYGLHPRESILFILKGPVFDFYDCYFVLRIILESNFRTIDEVLYGAGVDKPEYEIKRVDQKARQLKHWPFFFHSSIALVRSSRLSGPEKLMLWFKLLQLVRSLRRHHATLGS